jgi:hypothetical protein
MKRSKVLAVASDGGHWKQLLRLRPVFDKFNTTYITTIDGLPQQAGIFDFHIIRDVSRTDKIGLIFNVIRVLLIMLSIRPHAVISTGAAPGLIAIVIGRCMFCKTLWIDSIANGDQLSMSGRIAQKIAHQTISQWQVVAQKENVGYWGKLL